MPLWQDVKQAFRVIKGKPALTAAVVLTLGLGIGANSAIFSVVNALLLRRLPYASPDQLVLVWGNNPQLQVGFDELPTSPPNYIDWRDQNTVFEQMAAFRAWPVNLTGFDKPERLSGARVSSNLFSTLGVQPVKGRDFLPEDDREGTQKVVIISQGLWKQRFGESPEAVGSTLLLNSESYTIIGIMAEGFNFPSSRGMPAAFQFSATTDLWAPLASSKAQLQNRDLLILAVLARLKPSVSPGAAQAEMSDLARRLEQMYPENAGYGVKVVSLREQTVGRVKQSLLVLLGAVGLVLLLACTNAANLLLVRSLARQREFAIRSALGAARSRLITQALVESVVMAILGGVLGIFLARWGVQAMLALAPGDIPRSIEASVDLRVLGFLMLITFVTGVASGLAPALQISKTDLQVVLRQEGRSSAPRSIGRSLRSAFVVVEMAVALIVLCGAGLLIRSFYNIQKVDAGLRPDNVLTMSLLLPAGQGMRYNDRNQQIQFYRRSLERIEQLPGVQSAGAITSLPLSGKIQSSSFAIAGRPRAVSGQEPLVDFCAISNDLFPALAIPLLRGRQFNSGDSADAPGVVIINEIMAQRFWPNEDPLGRRITLADDPGPDSTWFTIVGVVGNVKQSSLGDEFKPILYFPLEQSPSPLITYAVHCTSNPLGLASATREAIWSVDPDVPISDMKTLEQVISESFSERLFTMLLFSIFAGLALILAVVGIYGVISFSVSERVQEIGVRMAIGASRLDVLKLITLEGLKLALIGVVIGIVAGTFITRAMTGLLYQLSATDPLTIAVISALLMLVAFAACVIPAYRATKIDPAVALRA